MLNNLIAIFAGIVVGFATAIPLGPVSIIVIQRTLARNRAAGLITGLGAVTADAFIAIIAAFSIHELIHFLVREHTPIRIASGIILLACGIVWMFSKPKAQKKRVDTIVHKIEYYISAIILTIANPFTPISFFFVFSNVQVHIGSNLTIATLLVVGTAIGSMLWWLLITHVAEVYEHKLTPETLNKINIWLGAIAVFIGVLILSLTLIRVYF
ncbi:MAG: lysine exporter protein [Candidatus Taylorbacteria bacterium]|nr:lysine exporter protein [Candidatus Taylorbacteria bacterium]